MKKFFQSLFVVLCILVSCILVGCKQDTIQFHRDSEASKFMKDMKNQNQNGVQKNSSGVIIFKDESSSQGGMRFGPADINFGS